MKKLCALLVVLLFAAVDGDAANYPLRVRKYLLDRGVTNANFRTDVRVLTDRQGNLQILRWNVPGVPQPAIGDLPDDAEAAVADLPPNQRTWDGSKWVAAGTNVVWTSWTNSTRYIRLSRVAAATTELRDLLLSEGMSTNARPFSLTTAVDFLNGGTVTQELKAVRLLTTVHTLLTVPDLIGDAEAVAPGTIPEDF